MNRLLVLALLVLSCAAQARDGAQVRAFRRAHPCPLTGKTTGPCAKDGVRMVVDHRVPICLQAYVDEKLDVPANMAWQEYGESLKKDRAEKALCASIRKTSRGNEPAQSTQTGASF